MKFQLPSDLILGHWNNEILPLLDSLNLVRSGLPASFIPRLDANNGEVVLCDLSFTLVDKGFGDSASFAKCVLRDPDSKLTPGMLNVVNRTIELTGKLYGKASFLNLLRADGQPLEAACVLGAPIETRCRGQESGLRLARCGVRGKRFVRVEQVR